MMMRLSLRLIALLLLANIQPASKADASPPRLDPSVALERSEAAIGQTVRDHRLTNSDGSILNMADFRGRPLVLSLVYTSCSSICPTTTQDLKAAVERARAAIGDQAFTVLTVGFDARNDTPQRIATFAADQDIHDDPGWRVASGSPVTISELLEDVGFSYAGVAGGFDHVVQTTIIDAGGQVYRHVYGNDFPLQVFVEPLKELVFGVSTRSLSPTDLADRIRFLCTIYDAGTGRYRTDYSIFIGIATGGTSLLLMGYVILRLWSGNRRLAQERTRELRS